MEEGKILKVISRVSYYCCMVPGRSLEPKLSFWLERPLKTNLNSLWHKPFIHPTDTGCVARAQWYSRAPYFIYSPWINNTASDRPPLTGLLWQASTDRPPHAEVCQRCGRVRTWVCACCIGVISVKSVSTATPGAATLFSSMFFFISPFLHSSSSCIHPSVHLSHSCLCTYPLRSGLSLCHPVNTITLSWGQFKE